MAKETKAVGERRLDPALVDLCRRMTPLQRLEAAIALSETAFQFHLAGVEFRKASRAPSGEGDPE